MQKEEDKPDMNDTTLGKYLERLTTILKDKCNIFKVRFVIDTF